MASAFLAHRLAPHALIPLAIGGAVLALLRNPRLGPIAIIIASLTISFSIETDTRTPVTIPILVVAALTALWILEMALRHKLRLHASRPVVPLLFFVGVAIIAFIAGNQPWLPFASIASPAAQAGGLIVWIASACAFLLAAHQIPSIRWLQALTWVFLAIGGVLVGSMIIPGGDQVLRATIGTVPGRIRVEQMGSLFWVWLMSMAMSQAVFNKSLPAPARIPLIVLALATLYVGLFTNRDWASGWMPALVAACTVLLVGAPRLLPLFFIAVAVFGVTLVPRIGEVAMTDPSVVVANPMGLAVTDLSDPAAFILGGDNTYSLATRLEAWRVMLEIISINPILGLGFANYSSYTPMFGILGFAVRFNSHNNYVDIVAQAGLLGLLSFAWLILAVGLLGWRLRREVPSGFARAYVYGALGGLAGTLVAGMLGDWVLPYVYNVGLRGFRFSVLAWIFLGGLVALEAIHRRNITAVEAPRGR